jgi:hypothetical protein
MILTILVDNALLGAVTPLPSEYQQACQYPKPVLLNTVFDLNFLLSITTSYCLPQGYAHAPYEWAPNSVNIQILRVGNFGMSFLDLHTDLDEQLLELLCCQ